MEKTHKPEPHTEKPCFKVYTRTIHEGRFLHRTGAARKYLAEVAIIPAHFPFEVPAFGAFGPFKALVTFGIIGRKKPE